MQFPSEMLPLSGDEFLQFLWQGFIYHPSFSVHGIDSEVWPCGHPFRPFGHCHHCWSERESGQQIPMWAMKKPWLVVGYKGIILSNYMGIIINHYKDPSYMGSKFQCKLDFYDFDESIWTCWSLVSWIKRVVLFCDCKIQDIFCNMM